MGVNGRAGGHDEPGDRAEMAGGRWQPRLEATPRNPPSRGEE